MATVLRGTLVGVSDILFNRMLPEDIEKLDTKAGGRVTGKEAGMEEAARRVYRDEDGNLGVPATNVKKAMLEGCKKAGLKRGKASMYTFLDAAVQPVGVIFTFNEARSQSDYINETTGRRPPKTGGRVIIRRPALRTGWRLPFALEILDDRIPVDTVKTSLEWAGAYSGLCDQRPTFGRFKVEWE